MRLLLETVDRVRNAIDSSVLIVRLSCTEYVDGGYSEGDVIALARALERAGVDALDLSGGSNESPQLSKYCIQPPSFPRGMLAPYAKPIKQAVKIPSFVAGRIVDPEDAEAVLASDSADFISLGRALYADAHWCLKAFGKVAAPIRSCIACNVCFERLTLEKDVSCVHNPMIGTEFETLEFAEPQLFPERRLAGLRRKRVLVLGAGVTGIEAARVLAGRGHQVEVWERSDKVGGQMPLAMAAPDKREVEPIWSYRWEEVQSLGVPVRTGVSASVESIRAYAPDFAVVATGAVPRAAPVDVSRLDSRIIVMSAWDFLAEPQMLGSNASLTIVGGGMVGMETADLALSRGCTVNVVEMLAELAQGMARNNRMELIERVRSAGARTWTGARIEAVHDRALRLQLAEGEETLEIGDALLFATGPQPVRDATGLLEAAGVEYALAGDCYRPGDFLSCIRDAWMVALSIEQR
jgi:NADPH-dependent 2,4-dienoyl-CoA reductase/sulfur reductase-like enzyme